MKKNKFYYVLMIESIILIVFGIFNIQPFPTFSSLIAFPFEGMGILLRNLSLSNEIGNMVAIGLYILICISPIIIFYLLKKKQKVMKIDLFLFIISLLLFINIYFMINPSYFPITIAQMDSTILGGSFYSVLLGYLILRFLNMYTSEKSMQLQKGLYILLGLISISLVFVIWGINFDGLLTSLANISYHSNGLYNATFSELFLIIYFFIDNLPHCLNLIIIFLSIQVLQELVIDRYSNNAILAVEKLANFSRKSIKIIVISSMLFNLAQCYLNTQLSQVSISISLPTTSIVFTILVLLLVQYIHEDQKLKQENDLFI